MPLTSPRLWIVATPLGNPGDLSPRAREILENADLILAEDTRRAAQLCRLCGIQGRRFLSFYDHNEAERQEEVLRLLREGRDLALISDAGTPLLADPGYRLVRACRKEGLPVSPVPGPSAPAPHFSGFSAPRYGRARSPAHGLRPGARLVDLFRAQGPPQGKPGYGGPHPGPARSGRLP